MTIAPPQERAEHILLHDVRWETYLKLREDLEDGHFFLTYDQGRLEIMAPLFGHEFGKKIVGRLLELMTLELDIPICSIGQTTLQREDLAKGLEADEGYYVANEQQLRHCLDLDLSEYPPPDLVLEVENTRSLLSRRDIYAAMGVPEIWTYDGFKLHVLLLREGNYEESKQSLSFPFLPLEEFQKFIDLRKSTDENSVLRSFQAWLRKEIKRS
jgi:Uma2 family endonuclease